MCGAISKNLPPMENPLYSHQAFDISPCKQRSTLWLLRRLFLSLTDTKVVNWSVCVCVGGVGFRDRARPSNYRGQSYNFFLLQMGINFTVPVPFSSKLYRKSYYKHTKIEKKKKKWGSIDPHMLLVHPPLATLNIL